MADRTASADKSSASPNYSAPALEKGIDILELLGDEPFGLTITEIAQRLGRSVSELFRVVVVLDRRGWLHKDMASDRYRVTYKLLELAHRATPAQELTHVATPLMHALAAAALQSCHLVVVNGARGLIVARQESPDTAGFAVRLGTAIDLQTTCSGRVLLAFAEDDRRADLLGKSAPRALTDQLAAIRAQGYATSPSARMAGVSDLSCPIFGFDGHVVAALTIPFLAAIDDAPHLSFDETLALLKATATDISSILGWYDREAAPVVPRLSVATPPRRQRRVRAD
ncbi:MAG: IclR family transcriptional regulator [Sphingomonas sp.]|uniref:IclR family transcriptional regulator n=1 Tax=Sphingomonas sp. TaxID=28214 RepID=UPI001AD17455|nr:IclR family transcriptional regulator [Sphingomonas sp.]MBN8806804.1 IclR family transcriptional regulator [Sphingomonas sp.]